MSKISKERMEEIALMYFIHKMAKDGIPSQVMSKISKERMGEIALIYFIHKMAKDGIPSQEELQRNIPNEAKKLGITSREALDFIKEVVSKAIGKRLGCEEVGLVFTWK